METTRRTAYDAAFKLKAIDLAVLEGNRAAAHKLGVNESMIRRWRRQQVELKECPKTRKAFRGHESRWPELEDVLEDWVNTQRAGGRGVSNLQIRLNAKSIARQMNIDNFNGGSSWCLRFMRRKNLFTRAQTTLCQRLPPDYEEKVTNFRQFVETKIAENAIGPDNIINMGEVPLAFDMSLTKNGASSILEKTNGHERTHFTCVLGCTASGKKLPPMVIFKCKTTAKDQLPKDIVVKVNQKGRMAENLMKDWLTECYGKRPGGFFHHQKALLVLDSMRPYITDSVKEVIKRTSTVPAVVPEGTAKYLQPLDISVSRAFKAALRLEWEAWMSSGDISVTETGRMQRASFSEVCQWILTAWRRVNEFTIINGFRKAGLLREEGTTASEPALPWDDSHTESSTDIETKKYYVEMEQRRKQERNFSSHQKKAETLQIKEEQDGEEHKQIRGHQEERNPPLLKEEQQEFEASQIKEEEEELCVSQDEDHLLLKWKTYTFEVSPVNEEKYHLEPDENQLDLQDAPEAENQVQEENDSQFRQDEDLEPNGKCCKNLFSGEMHDGFFPQDGSKTKRMRIHTDRPTLFRKQTSKRQSSETQDLRLRTRVPPVQSDDSCLSDSDNSDEDNRPKPGDESSSDEDSDSSNLPAASTSAAPPASAETRRRRRLSWETVQSEDSAKDVPTWHGSLPTSDGFSDETREPIQYFRYFFDADLLNNIVEQSNLYFTQESTRNRYTGLKLDRNELEQFIGTLVYMSILHLPNSGMYWSSECRVEYVADVMTRERWKKIKEFLHFNDNSTMAANSGDALFKIRPVFDSLLQKFNSLPKDQMLCIAQQMVPLKCDSSLVQYIPKRSRRWGYKIFVLCDTKGLIHSFDVFTGKIDPLPGEPDIGASGNIVLKLAQVIHGSVNHLLYFDRQFTSFDLFAALTDKGIPALGAVEQNGLQGCSFSTNLEMKKKGLGSFEEKRAAVGDLEIRAVKWFYNRGVIVASTFASAQPVANVQKWNRKLKQKNSVEYPNIINLYNKFVAGVDALDVLITSYRTQIRSRKYHHRLFCHFLDMVIVNSWLLYKRDCESVGIPRRRQKDFLAFRISIAQALFMQGKDLSKKKRAWPYFDVESEFAKKKRRGPAKDIPTQQVRSDAVGHWPVVESSRLRCKMPQCKGQTVLKCSKCKVHLCIKKNKNCFRQFHK
ncbi:chimeric ERCC6-PGBD3 protein-like isoform X2 [Gambusia affinis]|uniref:chimeric ERCC6-PGBD3 protein-like isoform X2 n=1 Tax=Gambusia affinis TaxID=33528 RepID=UPI001CDCAADD|nr:chimeric ERCC6-PGBD3 protein-like isoform X2 [Gambusia affinis]